MQHKPLLRGLAALALTASLGAISPTAHAESGRYNVHFSGLGPLPAAGEASFDWQLAQPFALEIRAGGGAVTDFAQSVDGIFYLTVGARFRFFEDESGYLDEGGSVAGHLWLAPHAGFFLAGNGPDVGFMLDASVGYDFSIVSPVSIGPFLRGGVGIGPYAVVPFVAGGLQVSVEIDPIRHPRTDTDGDGVWDARDGCPATPSGQPVNPAGCGDSDGDGVYDDLDACPDTPAGSEVDARGCIVLPPQLVLDGIAFEFGSAEILPSSEHTLSGAVHALTDNPRVRVEIGGHTDDIGSVAANQELSLARASSVRDWLVAHGVDASRLEVEGYGQSRPRAPNTDDASRALNRRIEFRQLE